MSGPAAGEDSSRDRKISFVDQEAVKDAALHNLRQTSPPSILNTPGHSTNNVTNNNTDLESEKLRSSLQSSSSNIATKNSPNLATTTTSAQGSRAPSNEAHPHFESIEATLHHLEIEKVMTPPPIMSKLNKEDGKHHVLFGVCGSISSKKVKLIIHRLEEIYNADRISIHLILTGSAERFISREDFPSDVTIWRDKDEWLTWKARTDPVLHIELRRWADILVVAPLTSNTFAKIALGLCDNLLTNVIRAWNTQFPILLAPSLVSFAYNSPVTRRHLKTIKEEMPWIEVLKPTEKVMGSFGEIGMGGMMDWNEIVDKVVQKLGGYPEDEIPDHDDEEEEEEEEREGNGDEDDDDDGNNDGNNNDSDIEDDEDQSVEKKLTLAEEDELARLKDQQQRQ
ncbi:hypothetical protein LJB42_004062 [Komagataella kurtzmanii]|nr:hypothetical protein LJB42_004062 [Komagataella kurtzmanii]